MTSGRTRPSIRRADRDARQGAVVTLAFGVVHVLHGLACVQQIPMERFTGGQDGPATYVLIGQNIAFRLVLGNEGTETANTFAQHHDRSAAVIPKTKDIREASRCPAPQMTIQMRYGHDNGPTSEKCTVNQMIEA
jgi:hypothetical protein